MLDFISGLPLPFIIGGLVIVALMFWALIERHEQKQPLGARFAVYDELKKVGLLNYSDWNALYLGHHAPDMKDKNSNLTYRGENHLVTFGKPASGKGAGIIIPNLAFSSRSFFVIDPKGQNAAITARRRKALNQDVYCLNPYGLFATNEGDRLYGYKARFNPLDRLEVNPRFVMGAGSLACSLVHDTGGNSHWVNAARELVSCLIMHVCLKYDKNDKENCSKRNLGEVRRLLCQVADETEQEETDSKKEAETKKEEKEKKPNAFQMLIADMMNCDYPPLKQKAAQFAFLSKEILSIISQARTQLAFLDDPAISENLSASDFDFQDMKRKKITVFLILPAEALEFQGRWLRLLVTSAIDALTQEPQKGDSRVVFLLDEFAQLGQLPAVERALALVRGYGVQLWSFLQDLPQLKAIYPKRWESFLAVSGVQQFFNPNDNETAGYISKRAGQSLITRKSTSSSKSENGQNIGSSSSVSYSDHWESFLSEWELYGMGDGKRNFLFLENYSPIILAWKEPYFDWFPKGLVDDDPYHQ